MPRRTTTLPLVLSPRGGRVTAHRWLCSALRDAILERRLAPGTRLPATRELAREYALARGTVVTAFEQLESEGYLKMRGGSGTFVNDVLPDELLQVGRRTEPADTLRPSVRHLSRLARRAEGFPALPDSRPRAFRTNLPAVDLFPAEVWAQISARRLRRSARSLIVSCPPAGYGPLREAIADYLKASRGVRCAADQVIVVSGAQEALDLACRVLLDPGDEVCAENPGYVGATRLFDAVGARVHALPVDAAGMQLPRGRARRARLAYVTPGHQFPTGVPMSLVRRLALLEWAINAGAMIFEDDYDSEYRYSGRPIPALQGLDSRGVVLFAGTFSKVLFPSIRLAYLVVPPDLIDRFSALKSLSSRHAPVIDQAVLADFIVEGHFGRHIRRMREVYAERLTTLVDEASRHLAGRLEVSQIEAGLQTPGWLAEGRAVDVAKAAAARHVEVTPLDACWRGRPAREGVLLGFAAVDPREIRRGIVELAAVLD